MASLEEMRAERLKKLALLKTAGMDAYPASISRDTSIADAIAQFDTLVDTDKQISLAGRVMSIRGQGAILFANLFDGTGTFQLFLKKDGMPEDIFALFVNSVDMGDFISATGTFITSKTGEKTLLVSGWSMASKSLLPLPEKWAGLSDEDERLRKRYLDAIGNPELFARFHTRANVIKYIRAFFDTKGFMEIETPILQNQAGGAMAKTFNTHHNDYDMDMVLRIAMELEHKMMMVAGYNRIYEIGKNFRNEGSDPTHIQEFTMMEWYAAYETLETNIKWTEELLKGLANDVIGKMSFMIAGEDGEKVEVNFDGAWSRVRFGDLLKENANLDMQSASLDDIKESAKKWGMDTKEIATTGRANLLDFIYKKSSRNKIVQPTFVMDYPGELKPLAQQNTDGTACVAQLIICGAEITNQYAELVNPIVERELFESQAKAKADGDAEAMGMDERFLTAMEHGMPPMTGFGLGIDRLVALLTEQDNLREVIFFPIMRPKV